MNDAEKAAEMIREKIAGALVAPFGEDGNVCHSKIVQTLGGVKAGTAASDDESMIGVFHSVRICMPPSTMREVPVV